MIARADTPARRGRFRSACREVPYYGAILPLEHALFGRSQPGRFYAGPTLALDLGSRTAVALGHANPEELAGFLAFGGVDRLIADGPAPAGWGRDETLRLFGLGAGRLARQYDPPADADGEDARAEFEAARSAIQDGDEHDWRAWFRLALAYDALRDRKGARLATRRAITEHRG